MRPLTYIKFLLFLPIFFGIERYCHHATDGFALVNIYAPKGDQAQWINELPLNELENELNQPFYYLNSGSQSYVFRSEDGKTTLKFFKFQHMRIPPLIDILPLTGTLAEKRELKRQKKWNVLARTLNSYKLAFEQLQDETGLLFIHLAPSSHLNKKVTIYDKIGKKHVIDLDSVEFVLQKKAVLVYETIDLWMAHDASEKAKKGIHDLLQIALKRCKKGIIDKDPDFSTNFGFIGEKPIQIDVGRLSLDENEKKTIIYQNEMIRITRHFQQWIEKNHPDLLNYFDQEIEKIITQN